jgi:hypothetical protein
VLIYAALGINWVSAQEKYKRIRKERKGVETETKGTREVSGGETAENMWRVKLQG